MKRKKVFLVFEEVEGDPEHKEIPIIRFKLQDAYEKYKGSIHPGRHKSDPIRVEGVIPGISELNEDDIKLEIKASPDDWEELYILGSSDPRRLGQAIFLNFAEPLREYSNRDKVSDLKSAFMRDSRQYVAAVYVPALYYSRVPSDEWPDFFRDIVDKFDDSKIANPKTGLPVASRIAHQCWKRQFEKRRRKLGLDDKETREDFKETYLDKNPYIGPAKDYFQKNDHTPTIKTILGFLKGLP